MSFFIQSKPFPSQGVFDYVLNLIANYKILNGKITKGKSVP